MRMRLSVKKIFLLLSLIILLLLLLFPSYILINRIYNDYPLREYIKDKFLGQLEEDVYSYFSSSNIQQAELNSVYINISDSSIHNLELQIKNRLHNLNNNEIILGTGNWKYINANLISNLDTLDIKLRVRGDMPSNYNKGIKNATLRINIRKGEAFNGKRKISIIKPKLESGYYGFLFYKCFKDAGFLSNEVELIKLFINEEYVGIRFLQEGFSKELIESSGRKEGVILRFKNDCVDSQGRYNAHIFPELVAYKEKKILKTLNLSKQYSRALNKYNDFIQGNIEVSDCFNLDEFARFYALNDIFLSHHTNKCQNVKLYFNPINDKFEPIAWDPNSYERYNINLDVLPGHTKRYGELCNNKRAYPLHFVFSKNEIFLRKYADYLYMYANNSYLKDIISEYIILIKQTEAELFTQNFQEHFDVNKIIRNIDNIAKDFNQKQNLYALYYKDSKMLSIRSICNIPVVVDSIKCNGEVVYLNLIVPPNKFIETKVLIDFEKKYKINVYSTILGSNKESKYKAKIFDFKDDFSSVLYDHDFDSSLFHIDYARKVIKLKNIKNIITENLYIPDLGMVWEIEPNTIIELNNANIICESIVYANGGSDKPINVKSNHTGGFIVKNAKEQSLFRNTNFVGLSAPSDGNWNLTGAVTFYKSNVILDSCLFINNKSEDALNIVNSRFEMSNLIINNCTSDALDVDFGQGSINNCTINTCNNDALDFSGSNIIIKNILIIKAGDKAISAGEQTHISGNGIIIDSTFIAVASKDSSFITINDITVTNSSYCFVSYQKKVQYDKAKIVISNYSVDKENNLIEEGCELFLDNKLIKGDKQNVYSVLYE